MLLLRGMPKWLQGMVGPTLLLWLCAAGYLIVSLPGANGDVPKRAELVAPVALSLVISLWVIADARKRKRRLCYDYDSFVYFAWPFLVPVYLWQTRGVKALLTLLCFGVVWIGAAIVTALLQFIRG